MSFHGDPHPSLAHLLYHREQQEQQRSLDLLRLYGSHLQNREHTRDPLHLYGSHPLSGAARDRIYGLQVFPLTPASASSSSFLSSHWSRGSQVFSPPASALSAYPPSDWGTSSRPYDHEPSLLGAHSLSVAAPYAGGRQYSCGLDSSDADALVYPANGGRGPPTTYSADRRSTHHQSIHQIIEETRKLHALWRSGVAKRSWEGDNVSHKNKRAKFEEAKQSHAWKQWKKMPEKEAKPVARQLPNAVMLHTRHKFDPEDVQNAWDESPPRPKVDHVSLTENGKQAHRSSELHKEACKDVAEFIGSSSEEEFSDEDYDSDYPQAADGGLVVASVQATKTREDQAYDFFVDLFEKNEQLQKLYKEECNAGKFQCLVCSSIAGKTIKKFNGLVSVVMHASTIQRTKRRAEHRGFGRAVCGLLGWEPDKTPILSVNKSLCPRGCLPADDEETIAASVQEERKTNNDSEDSKSCEGNSSDDCEGEQEDSEEGQ